MFAPRVRRAIDALVFLAEQGQSKAAWQISEVLGVCATDGSEVMQQLKRAGIVKSTSGRYGGYTIAHGLDQIPMRSVLAAIAGIYVDLDCPLGAEHCRHERPCGLRRRMRKALDLSVAEAVDVESAEVAA